MRTQTLNINQIKEAIKVKIYYDTISETPLDWNDGVKLAYVSNRYVIGNIHVNSLSEHLLELLDYSETYIDRLYSKNIDNIDLFNLLIERLNKKGYVAIPVYAYIHSGIALSTTSFNCRFDSGLSGFIYIKRSDYIKDFGAPKNVKNSVIMGYLKGILELYNNYLQGEIYSYDLLNDDGDILNSGGGFIGDNYKDEMLEDMYNVKYGYTKEEFKEMIDKVEISYLDSF